MTVILPRHADAADPMIGRVTEAQKPVPSRAPGRMHSGWSAASCRRLASPRMCGGAPLSLARASSDLSRYRITGPMGCEPPLEA